MDIFGLIALAKSSSDKSSDKSPFKFKGSRTLVNELPISGQSGDVYKVEQDNHYYAWGDNGWTDIGDILDTSNIEAYVNNELAKLKMLSFEEVEIIS